MAYLTDDEREAAIIKQQRRVQTPHDDLSTAATKITLLEMLNREVGRVAAVDEGTGLPNKAFFAQFAEKAYLEASQVALVYIDLNDFKPVNDKFGHKAGDAVLSNVGTTLRALHEGDIPATRLEVPDLVALGRTITAFRTGGDEFAMVLTDYSREDAIYTADQVRRSIAGIDHGLKNADGTKPVVSGAFGLVWYDAAQGKPAYDDLISMADNGTYASKQHGRDALCVASSPTEFYRVDDHLNLIPIATPDKEAEYEDRRAPQAKDRRAAPPSQALKIKP